MKLKINLDFGIDRTVQKDAISDREIFRNYLQYVVQSGYKNSLKSDQRRIWDNILNKLEEGISNSQDEIELNAIQIVFLKDAFKEATCAPQDAKAVTLVEEAINQAEQ